MNAFEPMPQAEITVPAGAFPLTVEEVTHYTDTLFAFRTDRPQSFRFRSGEFVMIGLIVNGKPLYRAYSVASPAWDEALEFFSIKVPDGPLTSRLQRIKPGDTVFMRQKSTGTLVLDALTPARRLYMFSTGTGIAPFASLIRDPETYEKFDEVILTQTCRENAELNYGRELVETTRNDELMSEFVGDKLMFHASATREGETRGHRVTTLIENGKLFTDLGIEPLNPETDRAMICGSMAMLREIEGLLQARGFEEGANNKPGTYVVERAFVD